MGENFDLKNTMPCEIYSSVRDTHITKREVTHIVKVTLRMVRQTDVSLSLNFIGDRRMRTLNRTYRHRDKTTDVLSFSTMEGSTMPGIMGGEIGDIFISVPQIRRQARSFGISIKQEMSKMIIHGILHLVGYDHIEGRDARIMLPLEEKILKVCL